MAPWRPTAPAPPPPATRSGACRARRRPSPSYTGPKSSDALRPELRLGERLGAHVFLDEHARGAVDLTEVAEHHFLFPVTPDPNVERRFVTVEIELEDALSGRRAGDDRAQRASRVDDRRPATARQRQRALHLLDHLLGAALVDTVED